MAPSRNPAAGWYTARDPHRERYFDGEAWTEHYRARAHGVIITAGWLTAVLIPVVGFVLGAIVAARQRVAMGVGVMVTALVVAGAIVAIPASAEDGARHARPMATHLAHGYTPSYLPAHQQGRAS